MPFEYQRILILKLSALGDIVMTLPLLSDIQRHFPQAKIDWLVHKSFQELLQGQSALHRILLFQRKEWGLAQFWKNRQSFFQLLRDLKGERYDLVLDFQGLFRSGFLAFCTASPLRVGFKNAREGAPLFYHLKVPVPDLNVHAFTRYQSLLEALHLKPSSPPSCPFPFNPSATEFIKKQLLSHQPPYLAVLPQTMWKTKIWGTAKLESVLQQVSPYCTPVFFGSPGGEAEGSLLEKASQGKGINLIGKTSITQLIAGLREMHVVLTNDSGPMHLAAALQIPLVAIFGPTNPKRTGPFPWSPHHLFQASDLPCLPCYKRSCPIHIECMKRVSAEEVASSLLKILGAL